MSSPFSSSEQLIERHESDSGRHWQVLQSGDEPQALPLLAELDTGASQQPRPGNRGLGKKPPPYSSRSRRGSAKLRCRSGLLLHCWEKFWSLGSGGNTDITKSLATLALGWTDCRRGHCFSRSKLSISRTGDTGDGSILIADAQAAASQIEHEVERVQGQAARWRWPSAQAEEPESAGAWPGRRRRQHLPSMHRGLKQGCGWKNRQF